MALINCPECGKEISDRARECPNCGYPINEYVLEQKIKNYTPPNKKISGIELGQVKRTGYTRKEEIKISEYKKQGIPYCPKCLSTSVQYTNKKLSIGRAMVGNKVFGEAGAIMGGLTSKKGYLICLNCGNRWKI